MTFLGTTPVVKNSRVSPTISYFKKKLLKSQSRIIVLVLLSTIFCFVYVSFLHESKVTDIYYYVFQKAPSDVVMKESIEHLVEASKDMNEEVVKKREKVRQLFIEAWKSYEKYAWGYNELNPLRKVGKNDLFDSGKLGATIIDAIDTAYLMGLKEEYEKCRLWISTNLTFDHDIYVSLFEVTIRMLGGLLSIYSFTKETLYLNKANELAQKLLPAFQSSTGVPFSRVNLKTKDTLKSEWAPGSILAEFGSLHLEFIYLSELTKNYEYANKVYKIRKTISQHSNNGLYHTYFDNDKGEFLKKPLKIGGEADSFYEYLLKSWLQSGKNDEEGRTMYERAIDSMTGVFLKQKHQVFYLANEQEDSMEHLTCFAGGMFALGAYTKMDRKGPIYFRLGEEITKTCHESYDQMSTHLGPEKFEIGVNGNIVAQNARYLLRPEVVESYFILWRLTHENKYRDWGWEVVKALDQYCKSEGGFHGLLDVTSTTSNKDSTMQTFFLAETADNLIPLNHWIFNTEAHPFPILNNFEKFKSLIKA